MLRFRFVVSVLLDGPRAVKTIRHRSPLYLGDPINICRIFNDKKVDEIIIVQRDAKPIDLNHLRNIISSIFVPVTYAGNISTLHDIHSLFSLGIERLSFNRSLLGDLDIIKAGTDIYGKQSFIASLDLKKPFFRQPQAVFRRSNKYLPKQYKHLPLLLDRIVSSNIFGEIHLNCVDTQGTFNGLPYFVKSFPSRYDIPMTVGGGIATCNHIHEAFSAGFSGVIASSSLYFSEPSLSTLNSVNINYPFEHCINQLSYD